MPNIIGIIADDLTGANDTALQFFQKGMTTEILLDYNHLPIKNLHVMAWATSTESRNIQAEWAEKNTYEACMAFKENLGVEHFYKKIDSTLRGNVAGEILSALEAIGADCAVVAPAFVQEGRITIGGYQLVRTVPIERTEAACDPHSPVYESNIVNILKKQLPQDLKNTVDLIDFSTVSKGAALIVSKLNELVQSGKKLIVIDAVSTTDIEQIVLAIKKCNFEVLPCGSAGLAQALAADWTDKERKVNIKKTCPPYPLLILSGSANRLSILQIGKLKHSDYGENAYFINLGTDDVLNGTSDEYINDIVENLKNGKNVVVYMEKSMSELDDKGSCAYETLIDEGISHVEMASKITKFLAQTAKKVKEKQDFILISVGGETSYKCCEALYCENLQVIDTVLPAIPLCLGSNAQLIVTKSGNLGTPNVLMDIIKYFEK